MKFKAEWATRTRIERAYLSAGMLMAALALVGLALPLVPQVPFALASAYFLSKGSPRLHQWIRRNPHFGKVICDWEDHRVVCMKSKLVATAAIAVTGTCIFLLLPEAWSVALNLVLVLCLVFVLTRNTVAPRRS